MHLSILAPPTRYNAFLPQSVAFESGLGLGNQIGGLVGGSVQRSSQRQSWELGRNRAGSKLGAGKALMD
jgi:hypothetical protein